MVLPAFVEGAPFSHLTIFTVDLTVWVMGLLCLSQSHSCSLPSQVLQKTTCSYHNELYDLTIWILNVFLSHTTLCHQIQLFATNALELK